MHNRPWRAFYRQRDSGRKIAQRKARLANAIRGTNESPNEHEAFLGMLPPAWIASRPEGESYLLLFTTGALDPTQKNSLASLSETISSAFNSPILKFGAMSGLELKRLEPSLVYSSNDYWDLQIKARKRTIQPFSFACIITPVIENDPQAAQAIAKAFSTLLLAAFGKPIAFECVFEGFIRHQRGRLIEKQFTTEAFTAPHHLLISEPLLKSVLRIWGFVDDKSAQSDLVLRVLTLLDIALNDDSFARFAAVCWTAVEICIGQKNALAKLKSYYRAAPQPDQVTLRVLKFYDLRNGTYHRGDFSSALESIETRAFLSYIVIDCLEYKLGVEPKYLAMEYAINNHEKLADFVSIGKEK